MQIASSLNSRLKRYCIKNNGISKEGGGVHLSASPTTQTQSLYLRFHSEDSTMHRCSHHFKISAITAKFEGVAHPFGAIQQL